MYIDIVDGLPVMREAKTFNYIPEYIRTDKDRNNYIRGRLKSWGDYSKKERTETIDKLIAEMIQAGVSSKKFTEILKGMSKEKQLERKDV